MRPSEKIVPTPSQTAGPFFAVGLTPERNCVRRIFSPLATAEPLVLTCRLSDGDGAPVPDAMIEIWQANAAGNYEHPDDPRTESRTSMCAGFGRLGTDERGSCKFETVMPGRVPGADGVLQAPHLNLAIFGRGISKQLHTRVYFADEPSNQQDPILALVAPERRETLIARALGERRGHWIFEIHLQGDCETVFFDV